MVKYIDNLSEDEIKRVGIPNGIPLVFKFKAEGAKLTPLPQELAEAPLSGEFLEKKGRLRKLLAAEAELAKGVPGFVSPPAPSPSIPVSPVPLTPVSEETAVVVTSMGTATGAGDYPRPAVDGIDGLSSIITPQTIGGYAVTHFANSSTRYKS